MQDKSDIRIAIATQGTLKPMGVFYGNYVQYLPYKKIILFGGMTPYFYQGTSLRRQKLLRYWYTLITLNNTKKIEKLVTRRTIKILKKEKINCVLAEFMNTGAGMIEACKVLNIPIVTTVMGYEIHKKDVVERNKVKYKKLANYKTIAIPVAKNMIPKLKKVGFTDDQISYSPIGAKEEFFAITPNYISKKFLAIGRFTASKSPQSTRKAFATVAKKYPEAKLIMAGDGEELASSKKLVNDLGIQKNVDFIGWIDREKQKQLFAECFAFVQHSVTAPNGDAEGTPVVIIEASAAGLPIISTQHGGIVDTVMNEKTGFLVQEYNITAMSEKMMYLYENPEIAEKIGKDGKKFISENFSIQHHIRKVSDAIETVLK